MHTYTHYTHKARLLPEILSHSVDALLMHSKGAAICRQIQKKMNKIQKTLRKCAQKWRNAKDRERKERRRDKNAQRERERERERDKEKQQRKKNSKKRGKKYNNNNNKNKNNNNNNNNNNNSNSQYYNSTKRKVSELVEERAQLWAEYKQLRKELKVRRKMEVMELLKGMDVICCTNTGADNVNMFCFIYICVFMCVCVCVCVCVYVCVCVCVF